VVSLAEAGHRPTHRFGKAAITITHGQRVFPGRALELGHEFRYPTLTGALDDLTGRSGDLWEEPHPP
jgi:NAD dependent epimerase/dehydratase family enzyme